MTKTILILLFVLLVGALCWGQAGNTVTIQGAGAPAGSCANIMRYVDTTNNLNYFCSGGTWRLGASSPGSLCTLTSAAANDVLEMSSPTACVNATPGVAISRTVAGASATLDCSNATGDRNKTLALTNAGAIALTGFTPGASCPDGAVIFVDVQGAAAVATLTPASGNCNGAATCAMGQGFWRVRSDGSQTFATVEQRSNISGATAGSYTNSSITVDAAGRVTAASSGSAGAYPMIQWWPQASTVADNSTKYIIPIGTPSATQQNGFFTVSHNCVVQNGQLIIGAAAQPNATLTLTINSVTASTNAVGAAIGTWTIVVPVNTVAGTLVTSTGTASLTAGSLYVMKAVEGSSGSPSGPLDALTVDCQ